MEGTLPTRVRFGGFEFDLRSGELRGAEQTVRLSEKPFRVLAILLEHAGELVTRDELQRKLWPNDTIVDFEHSINTAIKKLRHALGDSAEEPKYIETIPRHGYRLLVPVERVGAEDSSDPAIEPVQRPAVSPAAAGQSTSLIGKKVWHCRVLEVIGGGGMGMVYKAEDLKLGRRVALKFLPEELANDPVALRRFEREARTASSLNHPNICTIYDIEEYEDQPVLVMELLEGETLRDRLAAVADGHKALALDELLDIAIQLCEGLQAAHEKGIIHRDIKPANIFLTRAGQAKILDFGLAKLLSAAQELGSDGLQLETGGAADAPQPARTAPADATVTGLGVAMGTSGYMSPEQVRGEALDARSDLFSFGLVLYEMASGQRAFPGDTTAVIQESILNRAPTPPAQFNSTLPPKLTTAIDKALEKDRERRWQSAGELSAALQALRRELHPIERTPSEAAAFPTRRAMLWLAALILVIALTSAGFLVIRATRARPQPVAAPAVRQLMAANTAMPGTLSFSPDGKLLAYSNRNKDISLLQIDTGEIRSFPGTNFAVPIAAWSDVNSFFALNLEKPATWEMSIADGKLHKFADKILYPLLMSPDGRELTFFSDEWDAIWSIDRQGRSQHKILVAPPGWLLDSYAWSRTGERIVCDRWLPFAREADALRYSAEVELQTCDLGGQCSTILSEPRMVLPGNVLTDMLWLPDGRVIFGLRELPPAEEGGNLWSLQVDPHSGQRRGELTRLTNWMGTFPTQMGASADGKRLIVERMHRESVVKIAQLEHGSNLRFSRSLNATTWSAHAAGWTPNGGILFTATSYGANGVFVQKPTEAEPRALIKGSASYASPVITPDGQWLLYTEYTNVESARLMRLPLAGGAAATILLGDYSYRCAVLPVNLCVLAELTGNRLVFSILDPVAGRGRELASVEIKKTRQGTGYAWGLSPNGQNIALVDNGASGAQVWLLNSKGGPSRGLPLTGWESLERVAWSPDGSHLYVSGQRNALRSGILETDLNGNFQVVMEGADNQIGFANPIPSPDGRFLIYTETTRQSDVMMLENF